MGLSKTYSIGEREGGEREREGGKEREGERERGGGRERGRERERGRVREEREKGERISIIKIINILYNSHQVIYGEGRGNRNIPFTSHIHP